MRPKKLGINASYLLIDIEPKHVAPFLEMAHHMNALGFNVTQPHKKLVAELVDGDFTSVNTIVRSDTGWVGHSTDIIGLEKSLRRMNCELKAFKKIVVFGSGGVCFALLDYIGRYFDEGPEVVVCRRSAHRDSELKHLVSDRFKLKFVNLTVDSAHSELAGRAGETLWLQATSAPIYGNDLSEYARIISVFDGVFVDLVYGNASRIYQAALSKGILCQDGLPMLIEQARAAQILWWGRSIEPDEFKNII